MTDLADIEGIGPEYAAKLNTAGVTGVEGLLETGATPQGRSDLAAKAGVSPDLVLDWVNHADLYRISGVGSEYADLLEAAGVDSVVELAQRNAANLTAQLGKTNEEKNLVRAVPSESDVTRWIEQAKQLDRAAHY
jgi:predicted flap endonuclease-1-like 5' DNA nuclease